MIQRIVDGKYCLHCPACTQMIEVLHSGWTVWMMGAISCSMTFKTQWYNYYRFHLSCMTPLIVRVLAVKSSHHRWPWIEKTGVVMSWRLPWFVACLYISPLKALFNFLKNVLKFQSNCNDISMTPLSWESFWNRKERKNVQPYSASWSMNSNIATLWYFNKFLWILPSS